MKGIVKAAPENKLDAIVAGRENEKLDLVPQRSMMLLQWSKRLQIFSQRSYKRREKKGPKFWIWY